MSKKISKPEKLEFRKTYDILEMKTVDEEAGIYEVWISTEDVDRDGDIVEVAGADIKSYKKNPIVLFGHRYSDPEAVVGTTLKIVKKAGKGILVLFQFVEWGTSVGADVVRRLWKAGILKAASIGFRVLDGGWEEILTEDDRGEPRRTGWRFVNWELLEWSVVPVPANQEALRLAFKSFLGGEEEEEISLAKLAKELGEELPDFSIDDLIKAITGKRKRGEPDEDLRTVPGDPEEGEPTDEDLESVEDDELDIETDEEGAEDESDLNIDEDDELTEEDEAALDEAVANLEEVLDELALSTLPVRSNEDDS